MNIENNFDFFHYASTYENNNKSFVELCLGLNFGFQKLLKFLTNFKVRVVIIYTLRFWNTIVFKNNNTDNLEYFKHRFNVSSFNSNSHQRKHQKKPIELDFKDFIKENYLSFFENNQSFIDEYGETWKFSKETQKIIFNGNELTIINLPKADFHISDKDNLQNTKVIWKHYNILRNVKVLEQSLNQPNQTKIKTKKIITLLSVLFSASSFATSITKLPELTTTVVNSKQIGQSNGFDKKGYYKTNIFSANIEVKKQDQILLIPVLHTINNRNEETIILEKEKAPELLQELLAIHVTQQELLSQLIGKYKSVSLDF